MDIIRFTDMYTVQNIPIKTIRLMIKAINYGIVNDIFNPDDVETMIDMSNALYYKITMAGNIASEPMCGIL